MAVFNPIVITTAGLNLLSQAVAGQGTLTFTSVATSTTVTPYNVSNIQAMTSLTGIVQTVVPISAILQDGTVQVSAIFSNAQITQAYTANTIGLYAALDGGSQTLFAVAVATTPDNIPAQNNLSPSNFYYQFNIAISDTSQLTIAVPEDGNLPASVFNQIFPGVTAPGQSNDGDALVYSASSGAWGYVNTETALTTVIGSGEAVYLQKTLSGKFDQIQIFGKAIQDGTPAPDNEVPIQPVGNYNELTQKHDVTVSACGLNFVENKLQTSRSVLGVTYNYVGDGKYTLSGIATQNTIFALNQGPGDVFANIPTIMSLKPNVKYAIKDVQVLIYNEKTNSVPAINGMDDVTTYTANDGDVVKGFRAYVISGRSYNPEKIYEPMFYVYHGSEEPYTEYQGQQVQFPFDAPLYGVPVSSGGNYTDASGQQWISDVMDRQKTSVTRNCGIVIYDGSSDENWSARPEGSIFTINISSKKDTTAGNNPLICNRFNTVSNSTPVETMPDGSIKESGAAGQTYVYFKNESCATLDAWKTWLQSNPVTVVYQLATPTSEPFGFDLNTASATLQSLNPNTNIFSSTYPAAGLNIVSQAFNIAGDLAQSVLSLQIASQNQGATVDRLNAFVNMPGRIANGVPIVNSANKYLMYKTIADIVYPVGSIYLSVSSYNPGTLFGGTWEAWGPGQVPVGVDESVPQFATVERSGGEIEHTLSISEIPEHSHTSRVFPGSGSSMSGGGAEASDGDTHSFLSTGNAGGGQAHNNLQPYITCYMWKRTA